MTTTTAILPGRDFEGLTIPEPGRYTVDASHSELTFSVRHMMVSKVRGRFNAVEGVLEFADDPLRSHVEITIDPASIDTGNPDRDGHLRSADFFDVENHPAITFRSTGVRDLDGDEFTLHGELTVRDVTRPVTFRARYNGMGRNPWGQTVVGFEGRIELDREEFGLRWNQALETGGVLVGKVATIDIALEATAAD
jgi:polyisoprenoid-binding protein YceI